MSEKQYFISDYIKRKPALYDKMKAFAERSVKGHEGSMLRTLDMSVTSACNLKCKHCYASGYRNFDDLDLDSWNRVITEARELGVFHFIIQGGEPLLLKDRLKKILDFIEPESSFVNLITNCTLTDRRTLTWLKDEGVDKLCVSLDSGIPEEHDENRGEKGCFKRAVDTVFSARDMGFQVSLSTVVSHENIHSEGIRALFDFAVKNRMRLDIQVASPTGRLWGRTDLICDENDSAFLRQKMENTTVRDECGQLYLLNRDLYPRYGKEGCPAVKNFLSITSSGEILPCTFIHISLGNVRDVTLKQALEKGMKVKYLSEYWPRCLCGEDKEFLDRYLVPAAENPVKGLPFKRVEDVFTESLNPV